MGPRASPAKAGSASSPLSSKSSSMQDRSSPSSCSSEHGCLIFVGTTSMGTDPWGGDRPESRRNSTGTRGDALRLQLPSAASPVSNNCSSGSRVFSRRPSSQQQHYDVPSRSGYPDQQQQQQQQQEEMCRPESRRSSRSSSRGPIGAPPPAIEPLACTPPPPVSDALHPINPGLTFGSQLGRISAAGGFGRPTSNIKPSSQLFTDAMQGHAEHLARSNSDAGMDSMHAAARVTSTSPLGRMLRDDALSMTMTSSYGLSTSMHPSDSRGRPARNDRPSSRTQGYEDVQLPGPGRRSPAQHKTRPPVATWPHKLPPLHSGGGS